jgi:hypothetical protein
MMDITKLVSNAFGVGIVNAIGLVIFWFIGKHLFTKVLDTAATKALEDKRNEFTKELEETRQRFAKELELERSYFQLRLETERKEAARALEEFKADLTLGAEVRRQVAQKKVAILLEIVGMGEPLIRRAINVRTDDTESPMEPFMVFMEFVRRHQYVLTRDTAEALHKYNGELVRCMNEFRIEYKHETVRAAIQASNQFLELIRSELGINAPLRGLSQT